ncbi:MAG TPA: pyridoxamine 5'-phosphate oxidase family protein [Candidatus Paceibacterota bacterium]|nr:pyridoxamine 5'-phosphate oxidase family protein [Candidatus Paceibacterota bacterium]
MEDITDKRSAALAFLKSQDVGVLATCSSEGSPHVRTVYYAADDSFAVYFVTLTNTRKVKDLAASGKAAFVVSSSTIPATLQIEGVVADHTETATIDESVRNLNETLFAKGSQFSPLTHMDADTVRFLKLTPTWIRWGDFSAGQSSGEVFTEIAP